MPLQCFWKDFENQHEKFSSAHRQSSGNARTQMLKPIPIFPLEDDKAELK